MSKTARFIFYIIVLSLFIHIISLVLGQMNAHGKNTGTLANTWYNKFTFICDVLLTGCAIYSCIVYHKYFPVFINICYLVMLLLIFVASFSELSMFRSKPTALYSPKGLGTWINFGLLYFTAEDFYIKKVFKIFKYLCYGLFLFNLVQIALVGSISNREVALNAVKDTTLVVLWVYPFFFLNDEDKITGAKLLKYLLILLTAFFAFAISSRSYLLTIAIFIFIKLKRDLKEGRNNFILSCMIVMCGLAGYYLFSNIDKFGTIKDLLSVFTGRMGEDTRSGQLKEFMQQYKYENLFTGVGPNTSWNWSGDLEAPYQWLDNQFILLSWWFGIQTCLVYILYLLYSVFKKNVFKILEVTNAKIVVFFWVLACAGFGIYISFSSTLYYYFITFLIGLITLNVRQIRVYQVQNDNENNNIETNNLVINGLP